jgi:hypothetical protein
LGALDASDELMTHTMMLDSSFDVGQRRKAEYAQIALDILVVRPQEELPDAS